MKEEAQKNSNVVIDYKIADIDDLEKVINRINDHLNPRKETE